ncbi:MAG: NAD(+) synthase [Thermodesulfobacteriota bacterium]|nr:NAD(+) synthase [Thermodesulfobacteriota bacterium]
MQTDQVIDHITNWLKEYCTIAGMKGFVVGISGGIDSAVTSTLCAKTGRPVQVLNMPIFQDTRQLSLADRQGQWLTKHFSNVTVATEDLSPVFTSFKKTLPPDLGDNHTLANTRSRLRMITLYAYATHNHMLVTGTGNKVEDFGVGFYTKYGDGGVDISPIADLMKSEVYAVARHLGIIEDILSAPPTDGLWMDNRSDEDQLGATYEELEWAMRFDEQPTDETALSARQREVLRIYRKFNRANRHKMLPIPVCTIPPDLR